MTRYALHTLPDGSRALAFGLTWHTVFGERPDAQARRLARLRGARYYTRGGNRSHIVGLLAPTRAGGRPAARLPVHAAAACFARAYPRGPVAASMLLGSNVWVAVAIDGVVQSDGDQLFGTQAAACAHLEHWRHRLPGLVVHGELGADQPLAPDVLAQQLNDATRLLRAGWHASAWGWTLWALLAVTGAWTGWQLQPFRAGDEAARTSPGDMPAPVDAVDAWQARIEQWAQATPTHDRYAMRQMLDAIGAIPLEPGRWSLVELECSPLAAQCHARFLRTRLADSQSLRDALPAQWSIQWDGLQHATVQLPLPAPTTRLMLDTLPTAAQVEMGVRTQLQRIDSAFQQIRLSTARWSPVSAPTRPGPDGQPQAIPFPPASPRPHPRQRTLHVSGPLRSLYVLPVPAGLQLNRLTVRRAASPAPSLGASTLIAQAEGVIHEQ